TSSTVWLASGTKGSKSLSPAAVACQFGPPVTSKCPPDITQSPMVCFWLAVSVPVSTSVNTSRSTASREAGRSGILSTDQLPCSGRLPLVTAPVKSIEPAVALVTTTYSPLSRSTGVTGTSLVAYTKSSLSNNSTCKVWAEA